MVIARELTGKKLGLQKEIACNVCGGENRRPHLVGSGLNLVQCLDCGFIYVYPQPEPTELKALYGETYFRNHQSSVVGYSDYISDEVNIRRTARRRIKALSRYISSGKLLDVGCAMGFFIDEAKALGWRVSGIDVSDFGVSYARSHFGLDVFHGELTELAVSEAQIDLITMWDVIEHVSDPTAYIRQAAKLLRRGGYLSLSTPDVESLPARLYGNRWVGYKLSTEHVSYFSLRTLKMLLEKEGFELVSYGHVGKHVPLQLFHDRLSLYFPRFAKGLQRVERALGASNWSLYINPMDIIQVTVRLCNHRTTST